MRPTTRQLFGHRYHAQKTVVKQSTGIPGLLTRAGLADEISLLGPVLDDAELSEAKLLDLFNDGSGIGMQPVLLVSQLSPRAMHANVRRACISQNKGEERESTAHNVNIAGAVNLLLEEAGIIEASHRIAITSTLNGGGQRMRAMQKELDCDSGGTTFLVLQGAGSYLWESDLDLVGTLPLTLIEVKQKIGVKLQSFKNRSPLGFMDLRSMANCLYGRLLLVTPLLGRSTYAPPVSPTNPTFTQLVNVSIARTRPHTVSFESV